MEPLFVWTTGHTRRRQQVEEFAVLLAYVTILAIHPLWSDIRNFLSTFVINLWPLLIPVKSRLLVVSGGHVGITSTEYWNPPLVPASRAEVSRRSTGGLSIRYRHGSGRHEIGLPAGDPALEQAVTEALAADGSDSGARPVAFGSARTLHPLPYWATLLLLLALGVWSALRLDHPWLFLPLLLLVWFNRRSTVYRKYLLTADGDLWVAAPHREPLRIPQGNLRVERGYLGQLRLQTGHPACPVLVLHHRNDAALLRAAS